ncbi:hypothetical protein IQ266_11330 [filamentous cyanobacterium LEGE 11480]|uniref:Uncharacterized protein n=1 Tax=Romeriopsis navalis LEGE 11480 TaxID=2777977 RepID=A0A928VMA9_9CYAN|nr:hypothetical protein [Romeriopsis navalis]MBE9030323.1 hypothetical protein [Romeriopsis navalis LEGE 11480]
MKLRIISIALAITAMLFAVMPHVSHGKQPAAAINEPATSSIVLPAPKLPESNLPTSTGESRSIAAGINLDSDSPCYYRKSDGTLVDLRSICGQQGNTAPTNVGSTPVYDNPAMRITPPNDPGVLYLSDSGQDDPAAQAASQAEETGGVQ